MRVGHDPVRVPSVVLDGIEAVRVRGITNMLERPRVAEVGEEMGFNEAARWIRENPGPYVRAVFHGLQPGAQ